MTCPIGYLIREQDRLILTDPEIDAAEILFERADDPLRADRYPGDYDLDYLSIHARALSVGSAAPPAANSSAWGSWGWPDRRSSAESARSKQSPRPRPETG
jgi:hypothetical protein